MEIILFSLSVISSVIKPQNETSFSLWRESKDCLFRVIPWDWIEAALQFLVVTMTANSKGQTHLFSFHVLLWHQLHHHSFGLSCYHIHSVYNAANLPSIKCTLLCLLSLEPQQFLSLKTFGLLVECKEILDLCFVDFGDFYRLEFRNVENKHGFFLIFYALLKIR